MSYRCRSAHALLAGVSVIALTLLTSQLAGALWGLLLVIAGCVYGYRWAVAKRRKS